MFWKLTKHIGFVATSFLLSSHHHLPTTSNLIQPTQPPHPIQTTMHTCLQRRRPPQQGWGSAKHRMLMSSQSNAADMARTMPMTMTKKILTNRLTTRNRPWRPKEGQERGESEGRQGHLPKGAIYTPICSPLTISTGKLPRTAIERTQRSSHHPGPQYFTMPHWFLQEWTHSTGICRSPQEWHRNPQEWAGIHRNGLEWHWNGLK